MAKDKYRIDSNTSDMIRTVFSLEVEDSIAELLPGLWTVLRDLTLPMRNTVGNPDFTFTELCQIAALAPREVADHVAQLKGGDPVRSYRHSTEGEFLRIGSCGWPVCEFDGVECLCNPKSIEAVTAAKPAAAATKAKASKAA